MTDTITLTYTNSTAETVSAMTTGGAAAGRRYRDWAYVILSWTIVALIAGGGAFFGLAVWIFALDQGDGLHWLLPLCVIAAIITGHLTFKRMIHAQAVMTTRSQFGRVPQTLVFDATGVTQTNTYANWHTNWQAVEFIHSTKHGLSLTISGIVIPIPDAAFDGSLTKSEVFDQLTQWHQATQ